MFLFAFLLFFHFTGPEMSLFCIVHFIFLLSVFLTCLPFALLLFFYIVLVSLSVFCYFFFLSSSASNLLLFFLGEYDKPWIFAVFS